MAHKTRAQLIETAEKLGINYDAFETNKQFEEAIRTIRGTLRTGERCANCPWKAGLLDAHTICPQCKGTGVN